MKKLIVFIFPLMIIFFVLLTGFSFAGEIHDAAARGDLEKVKEIVAKNPQVINSMYGEYSRTPLFCAAEKGHEEIVKFLLGKGASVNNKDSLRQTPLHVAAVNGHAGVAAVLIDHGAEVNHENKSKDTPLYLAADNNRPKVADILLKNGAKYDMRRITALHSAAMFGGPELLDVFLKNGADVNYKGYRKTVLYYAVLRKRSRNIQFLLRHGAVRETHGKLDSSIKRAAEGYKKEIKKMFIVTPDNPDDPVDESTIFYALCYKTADEVRDMINKNPELVKVKTYENWTPLHVAVIMEQYDCIPDLVSKGVDINAQSMTGWTALHWASKYVRKDAISILLKNKADPNIRDKDGEIPVFKLMPYAGHTYHIDDRPRSINGEQCLDILKLFKKYGTDFNARSRKGRTLIYDAVDIGRIKVIEYLVLNGVKLNQKWSRKYNPMIAVARGDDYSFGGRYVDEYIKILNLLLDNGTDINSVGIDKMTILHELAMATRQTGKMIKVAIKRGADIHQGDRWNNTPLHIAAFGCRYVKPKNTIMVMQILLEAGADINAKNINGQTTLHFAAMRGNKEACKFLVSQGADINAVNRDGDTPLAFAFKRGFKHLGDILQPVNTKTKDSIMERGEGH